MKYSASLAVKVIGVFRMLPLYIRYGCQGFYIQRPFTYNQDRLEAADRYVRVLRNSQDIKDSQDFEAMDCVYFFFRNGGN